MQSDCMETNLASGLNVVDKTIGRAIMAANRSIIHQLWLYSLCKLLAKLHSPLVIGVDIPDYSLGKDLVLVHSYHSSQGERSHQVHHDAVGGPITSKFFVGTNLFDFSVRFPSSFQFLLHSLPVLPLHECLSLCQEVAK